MAGHLCNRLGAVERGRHYLEIYPGWGGWTLAIACTGVVFFAGAKLLELGASGDGRGSGRPLSCHGKAPSAYWS